MNWLIKLLGGYTAGELEAVECSRDEYLKRLVRAGNEISDLSAQLREAQKNGDDKGRYTAPPKPNEGT